MSRTVKRDQAVARFSGPPAGRMKGRSARAAGNLKPAKPKTSAEAATVARANAFLDREALLDQAIHAGVIGSGMRAHYAACFDADPDGTRAYLQGIGLPASQASAPEAYADANLSFQERNRIAAAREGKIPRIGGEGL
jgi:hypothetical protein